MSRMGRNPFAKKDTPAQPAFDFAKAAEAAPEQSPPKAAEAGAPGSRLGRLVSWALVDVPADAFVLGLKTVLLAREKLPISKKRRA